MNELEELRLLRIIEKNLRIFIEEEGMEYGQPDFRELDRLRANSPTQQMTEQQKIESYQQFLERKDIAKKRLDKINDYENGGR